MVGPGVPGNPELGSRELKGQAEVEEEESFLGSTFCWMVDQFFYDSSWHALSSPDDPDTLGICSCRL